MSDIMRSQCPINLTLEVLGDKWSLIIIRDIVFGGRRHYRDLLDNSLEGIASNILTDRLRKLSDVGLLTTAPDPGHKQKTIYSLTEAAIQLVPVLAVMGEWGTKHRPVSMELSARARVLADGGPKMWANFMDELRSIHLGGPRPKTSVLAKLEKAFETAESKSGT